MAWGGIDVRKSGQLLFFAAAPLDSNGAKVTAAGAVLRLYELEADATVKQFDFNDNTFHAPGVAVTTPTLALTHRTTNAGANNTGLHTNVVAVLTGFSVGGMYVAQVTHAGASPPDENRLFQYGASEGDDLATLLSLNVSIQGTVVDNAATTLSFVTDLAGGTNVYDDMWLVFRTGTNAGIPAWVASFDDPTNRIILGIPLPAAPANADKFSLIGKRL